LRKFLSEIVPFFPELQADVQDLEELKGNGMLKSEGLSRLSDLERPTAGFRNDANEGEDSGSVPGITH
jgi:hypothetical protein